MATAASAAGEVGAPDALLGFAAASGAGALLPRPVAGAVRVVDGSAAHARRHALDVDGARVVPGPLATVWAEAASGVAEADASERARPEHAMPRTHRPSRAGVIARMAQLSF
ncbi:hypothetical protein [Nannocystis pusilla]|uniref:hypothetical protein n=1 Tax=Nannocystis pusilla TaxID=889268 RepID=UPI003B777369